MKKLLMALAVGTALVVPQMPASAACIHANPPEVHIPECVDAVDGPSVGGCSFAGTNDVGGGEGERTAWIHLEAVVYSLSNPADNPMSATFTCYILVNGSRTIGVDCVNTGTVVVVGGCAVPYKSNSPTDFVQLCQEASYSNGVSTIECFEADTFEIPPPIVWEIVDPLICPVIAAAAPGAGPVFINSQGDVWIDGEGFFDCPPYGNVFGFPPNG